MTEESENTLGYTIVQSLTHGVNGGDCRQLARTIAQALLCEHRTLQASAVRVLLLALDEYARTAHENGWTDLRNEAAVKNLRNLDLKNAALIPFV
jgi:hypothetical protein